MIVIALDRFKARHRIPDANALAEVKHRSLDGQNPALGKPLLGFRKIEVRIHKKAKLAHVAPVQIEVGMVRRRQNRFLLRIQVIADRKAVIIAKMITNMYIYAGMEAAFSLIGMIEMHGIFVFVNFKKTAESFVL